MDKDTNLIFEAYKTSKVVNEANESQSGIKTLAQINDAIDTILNKYDMNRESYESLFDACKEIHQHDLADAKRLRQLVSEYEAAYKREHIVKPHLEGGNQTAPQLNVGDKVKVDFESFNKLTGTVTRQIGDKYVAKFGRGLDAFESSIKYQSWDGGKTFSWKEDAHLDVIDKANPAPAIEQHADLMTDEERQAFIEGGHDLDAVKRFRRKHGQR